MTENSNKQTKKRKYFRAKMLRIPPHSFVNKSCTIHTMDTRNGVIAMR